MNFWGYVCSRSRPDTCGETDAQKDVSVKDNRRFPRLRTVPKNHKIV